MQFRNSAYFAVLVSGEGGWHTSKCSLIWFKLELSLVLKLLLHILNYLGQKYARSWNSTSIFTVNIAGFKKFLHRSNRHCSEYIMQNKHKEATLKHKDNHEICYKYNGHLGYKKTRIDIKRLVFFPQKAFFAVLHPSLILMLIYCIWNIRLADLAVVSTCI